MGFWATRFFAPGFWAPGFWAGAETPTSTIPQGGSGYPVYRKREPKSPSNSIDALWDLVASEHYKAICVSNAPSGVKKQAIAVVKPFAKASTAVEKVDWDALSKNANAVMALFRIWNIVVKQREIDNDDEALLLLMS